MRKVEVLRENWLFRKGDFCVENPAPLPRKGENGWKEVTVPHDWAAEGPFDGWNDPLRRTRRDGSVELLKDGNTGALPYAGCGVYFYRLCLPDSCREKRVFLEFDGVMSHASVFVNGKKVFFCAYGYTSFTVDITSFVSFGGRENFIFVKAENPPNLTRWYPGAGIFREVRLLLLEKRHLPFQGVVLENTVLDVEKRSAVLKAKAEGFQENELNLTVAREGKVLARGGNTLALEDLALWSPEEPFLYEVTVSACGDSVTIPWGFREAVFHAEKGMFLNGKKYPLRGLCMHHDLGVLGAAFDKDVMRWRLRKLKNVGCNALRMSHNPPDPQLLDLCDEMGFLVMDEAFDVWRIPKTQGDYHNDFDSSCEFDLRSLVRRDRNHPCVILWSIGNEIRDDVFPGASEIAGRLAAICHEEDPSRPVTCAISHQQAEENGFLHGFAEKLDVIGFNYKPDLYPLLHARFPSKPLLGSETAAVNTSRGEYYFPVEEKDAKKPFYSSAYAVEHAGWSCSSESMFASLEENPFMAGEFAWCAFDYLGEPFPFPYPARSSAWGLFDLAGLPKDRAYLYAAQWHREGTPPVLHILPHWEWKEGEKIPVHVFSSCNEVELFLNGKSLGRRKKPRAGSRFVWESVPFEKGILEAVGFDAHGHEAARARRETPDEPCRIAVKVEKEYRGARKGFYAFIELFMTDSAGRIVEKADDLFRFSLKNGTLVGVDNGDSCSLLPFKRNFVSLHNGHAMILALFGEEGGSVSLETGTLRETFEVEK